jgi:hypothetical protein
LLKKNGKVVHSDTAIVVQIGGTSLRTVADTWLPEKLMKKDQVTFIDRVITVQIRLNARSAQIAKAHDIIGSRRNQDMSIDTLRPGRGVVSIGEWRAGPAFSALAPGEELTIRGTGDRIQSPRLNRDDRGKSLRNLALSFFVGAPCDDHAIRIDCQ